MQRHIIPRYNEYQDDKNCVIADLLRTSSRFASLPSPQASNPQLTAYVRAGARKHLWYNKDEEVIGLPEGTALFVTGEHDCEVIGPKDAEALYWFRQAEMGMRLERIALGTKFDLRKIVPGGKL